MVSSAVGARRVSTETATHGRARRARANATLLRRRRRLLLLLLLRWHHRKGARLAWLRTRGFAFRRQGLFAIRRCLAHSTESEPCVDTVREQILIPRLECIEKRRRRRLSRVFADEREQRRESLGSVAVRPCSSRGTVFFASCRRRRRRRYSLCGRDAARGTISGSGLGAPCPRPVSGPRPDPLVHIAPERGAINNCRR